MYNLFGCVDGGLFCVGLPVLISLVIGWLFNRKCQHCAHIQKGNHAKG